jgi:hypothetical protein
MTQLENCSFGIKQKSLSQHSEKLRADKMEIRICLHNDTIHIWSGLEPMIYHEHSNHYTTGEFTKFLKESLLSVIIECLSLGIMVSMLNEKV